MGIIELAESESKLVLTRYQLNQIIRTSYREGSWNESYGAFTGMPEATLREPLEEDCLVKHINTKLEKRHKTFKLPPEIVDER